MIQMTEMRRNRTVMALVLIALGLVPPISAVLQEPYYLSLFTRIVIFAIAAVSLDLILGYGGLVSFSHAIYLGVGAYAFGILNYYGVSNGYIHFIVAILAAATVALCIGVVSLRTSGVHFIMITLAFGQMLYFLALSINTYGGDDGLPVASHSDFGSFIDLDNPTVLYYFAFTALLVFLWLGNHLVHSRFGMIIRGVKSNERRMVAIGCPTFRYKLAAFVISGAMCGFGGALLANQALFVSPAIMQWARSGEIMVMVIVGGIGTLFGPLLGAVLYLVVEDVLSGLTTYWQMILGIIVIGVVLFAKRGLMGLASGSPGANHG